MKKLKIGDVELDSRYILAPLAGYTNLALRQLASECGASLTYTEMISVNALVYDNVKTIDMLPKENEIVPVALQLFGGDLKVIDKALDIVNDKGHYDLLDFNLGCPVPKVIRQKAGSAWLKREDELYDLFHLLVTKSKRPVVIKTRLGFDLKHINILKVVEIAKSAGISAIAIHGRTRDQYYGGKADYDWIKKAKDLNLLPIIANGDITEENFLAIDSKYDFDGYMLGRGALGNPMIFKNLQALEEGKIPQKKTILSQIELMNRHLELLLKVQGETNAIRNFRGISTMYLKGLPGMSQYKVKLVQMNTYEDYLKIVEEIKSRC